MNRYDKVKTETSNSGWETLSRMEAAAYIEWWIEEGSEDLRVRRGPIRGTLEIKRDCDGKESIQPEGGA